MNAKAWLGLSVLAGIAANLYAITHFAGHNVEWPLVALGLNIAWWSGCRSALMSLAAEGSGG